MMRRQRTIRFADRWASAGSRDGAPGCQRRGLTLLEALIASVILAGMVVATSAALSSSQQHGQFAQNQVQGSLAAEAKLAEILADDYVNLITYNGSDEPPGTLQTSQGVGYPSTFYRVGRRVTVQSKVYSFPDIGTDITGMEIAVTAYDVDGVDLFTVTRFVPEP